MPVFIFKWKTRVVRGLCTEAPLSPSLNPSPSTVNGRIPSVFALSSFPGIEIRLTSFNTPERGGVGFTGGIRRGFRAAVRHMLFWRNPLFHALLCPLEQPRCRWWQSNETKYCCENQIISERFLRPSVFTKRERKTRGRQWLVRLQRTIEIFISVWKYTLLYTFQLMQMDRLPLSFGNPLSEICLIRFQK